MKTKMTHYPKLLRIEVHFVFFTCMNEILPQHGLMDTFLVGNYCHIFKEDYKIKCSQHFKKQKQKIVQKGGNKMDFYPAMGLTNYLILSYKTY